MSAVFEFVSERSSGVARFGEISFGAGSIVNSAILKVDPARADRLDLTAKDPIVVWMIPDDTTRFEVFRGVVSKVRTEGAFLVIEAVTVAAYAAVRVADIVSWSDSSMKKILLDLVVMSGIDASMSSLPSICSDTILHVWNTHGATVAEEIDSLLRSSRTGLEAYGAPDGRFYFGDRAALSSFYDPFPFPWDESFGDTDSEITKFSPRSAHVYQVVFDPSRGSYMGTIDFVSHVIDETGASTFFSLDEDDDSVIQARLSSLVPAAASAIETDASTFGSDEDEEP